MSISDKEGLTSSGVTAVDGRTLVFIENDDILVEIECSGDVDENVSDVEGKRGEIRFDGLGVIVNNCAEDVKTRLNCVSRLDIESLGEA